MIFFCAFVAVNRFYERMNMDIKEFSANMKIAVSSILGEGYEVEERLIQKNNGIELDALVIRNEEEPLAPTIYLKKYYENYLDGESIRDGAARLAEDYRDAVPKEKTDMSFFGDYEKVKNGLSYKLISAERNGSLLKKVPFVPFLDLAIVFYYSLDISGIPDGTILIRDVHLDMWGIDRDTLIEDARKNGPELLPGRCRDMFSVLSGMKQGFERDFDDTEDLPLMYVVSNTKMINGASAMLYPGVMSELSCRLGRNLYIIPSSIHELIIIPDDGLEDIKGLKDMIYNINRTQVEPQDVLSDSLYYFDCETEKITIA